MLITCSLFDLPLISKQTGCEASQRGASPFAESFSKAILTLPDETRAIMDSFSERPSMLLSVCEVTCELIN